MAIDYARRWTTRGPRYALRFDFCLYYSYVVLVPCVLNHYAHVRYTVHSLCLGILSGFLLQHRVVV